MAQSGQNPKNMSVPNKDQSMQNTLAALALAKF